MITKDLVQELLDQFYNYISFAKGEEPDLDKLKRLFVEGAVVIEFTGQQLQQQVQKDIENHIEEFKKVLENYPLIKQNGFIEKELNNQITTSGPMAFAQSQYEKTYFNGKSHIKTTGTNCLQIAKLNGEMKIISIGWYED